MAYDIVIKNGLVVDGTGSPARPGDVAIKDGRIQAVGKVAGAAARTVNAHGLVVAPGFIDVHTHYDGQLVWDPFATPSCFHGVTTVLIGNCGYTLAPCRPEDRDYLVGLFGAAEQVPRATLEAGVPFGWTTYREYLDWFQRRGLGVNVIAQVGHSAVRRYVMGKAALEREATEDEVRQMVNVVADSLDAGARGFSTSQAPHQVGEFGEHIPSYFATHHEVETIAATLRKTHGLLTLNPRTKMQGFAPEDREFLANLTRITGGTVSWNDFTARAFEPPDRWQKVLAYAEGEVNRGIPVYAVARCQPMDLRFTLRGQSVPFANLKRWTEFFLLDTAAKMRALADPAWRTPMAAELHGLNFFPLAGVLQGASDKTRQWSGLTMKAIAAKERRDAADLLLDIGLADELNTQFAFIGANGADETAVERILKSPAMIIGISDGGAHLQTFATCEYTTYFLQRWVRERKAFTLEEGVQALTSRPARVFGLTDRGTLAPGQAADVVIFDKDAVGPLPIETVGDLPGGAARLVRNSTGVPWVLVNGQVMVEEGKLTGTTAGRVLASQKGP